MLTLPSSCLPHLQIVPRLYWGFISVVWACVMHSVMLVQWWVTWWCISQNVSPSVRHYMTGYFHQKANATGLWIIYRITDYTVPPGEGTECCPVSGPQGTLLFRSLSFLSVKGGGPDTEERMCVVPRDARRAPHAQWTELCRTKI